MKKSRLAKVLTLGLAAVMMFSLASLEAAETVLAVKISQWFPVRKDPEPETLSLS